MCHPTVGMGVTFMSWLDRHPGTIQEVFVHGQYIYIGCSADISVAKDDGTYEYEQRPNSTRQYFRRHKDKPEAQFQGISKDRNGRWCRTMQIIRLGVREKYHEACF